MQLSLTALLAFAPLISAFPSADRTTSFTGCSNAGISAQRAQQVKKAFNSARVVPDVVPSIDPKIDLKLSYAGRPMNLGTVYGILETLKEPEYEFAPEKDRDPASTKYTIIYADPDAPGPELPLLRQFLHYIEYDVQPTCINNQSPKTLAMYMALTPLSVAKHRYTYLIYRQPPGEFKPSISLIERVARAPFDLQKFVDEYKLELVGGNFMRLGLSSALVPLVPGATQDGTGYSGPKDGSAEPAEGLTSILAL